MSRQIPTGVGREDHDQYDHASEQNVTPSHTTIKLRTAGLRNVAMVDPMVKEISDDL
jgi:hypothetical protein